jgi:AcrR family transcriptional regulator
MMGTMPRVSDQHLAARRQQILDAARVCFTRTGFHATTMHDVIREADLSVGAVYRYFKSKEELIAAMTEQVVTEIVDRVGEAVATQPPLPLDQTLERVFRVMHPQLGPDGMFRVALQLWSEALRNPALAELVATLYARLRAQFIGYAHSLRPDADAEAVATVMVSIVQGYALQRVLSGEPDMDRYLDGVRALVR